MGFVLRSQEENGRDSSSWADCILSRAILEFVFTACCCLTWPLALGVCASCQGQPRGSSPLWLGGGIIINERLIKALCCHIPGCLSHLPNNIHHSFTQPPHILVAGWVPVTQEGLYDLCCQAFSPPPTPKHDNAESPCQGPQGGCSPHPPSPHWPST